MTQSDAIFFFKEADRYLTGDHAMSHRQHCRVGGKGATKVSLEPHYLCEIRRRFCASRWQLKKQRWYGCTQNVMEETGCVALI